MLPPPPISTLFPYTTLFRSASSSVWNVVITAIGPKRSSSNAAIPGYAGELRRLEEESWARSAGQNLRTVDRKSTRLNSSHQIISYAVFCLKKKKKKKHNQTH